MFYVPFIHLLAPHLTPLLYDPRTATRVPTRVFADRVGFSYPLPLAASLTLQSDPTLPRQAL